MQSDGTFACLASGCVIEEHHKDLMFAERGYGGTAYWKPTNPDADPYHHGYHAWAAYAPLGLGSSWKDLADAKPKQAATRTKRPASTTSNSACPMRASAKSRTPTRCPSSASRVCTAASCRWVLDYAVIDLDPTILDTYPALDEYLRGTWKTTRGIDMPITAVALDGGNWTETVAQFVKQLVNQSGQARILETPNGYIKQTVYLIRGRNERKSERAVYRPAKTEVNNRDKTVARSVGVWGVGTSVLKTMVYGWLSAAFTSKDKAEAEGQAEDLTARMLRFPGGRGDEVPDPINPDTGALLPAYYKGLTVEFYDKESGYWIKPKGARNEALDTAGYAIWASLAPAVKADVILESHWDALQKRYHESPFDLFAAKVQNGPQLSRPDPPSPKKSYEKRTWFCKGRVGILKPYDELAVNDVRERIMRAMQIDVGVGEKLAAPLADSVMKCLAGEQLYFPALKRSYAISEIHESLMRGDSTKSILQKFDLSRSKLHQLFPGGLPRGTRSVRG
nr:terminase gpA endonuclease subunit [Xanthomonas dyei]